MQYPQIQFYRGSLVRLASGKLKQVEDLSSDDFLESARLARSTSSSLSSLATINGNIMNGGAVNQQPPNGQQAQTSQLNQAAAAAAAARGQQQVRRPGSAAARASFTAAKVDENNNSVFNSPEPTPSFDSPTMDMMETDDLDDYMNGAALDDEEQDEDDDDEELDVVSDHQTPLLTSRTNQKFANQNNGQNSHQQSPGGGQNPHPDDDLYIDSSVVRDFLEVGPPSSASPPNSAHNNSSDLINQFTIGPSTSTSTSSNSPGGMSRLSGGCLSPPINLTVLIKFFLESSRSIVFIEVPIEHPFFVLHRGWSSWNPQRTFDKFGLKCRKLKIGDTCISLIRRNQKKQQNNHHHHQQQQESDQCNIMFSGIKINE